MAEDTEKIGKNRITKAFQNLSFKSKVPALKEIFKKSEARHVSTPHPAFSDSFSKLSSSHRVPDLAPYPPVPLFPDASQPPTSFLESYPEAAQGATSSESSRIDDRGDLGDRELHADVIDSRSSDPRGYRSPPPARTAVDEDDANLGQMQMALAFRSALDLVSEVSLNSESTSGTGLNNSSSVSGNKFGSRAKAKLLGFWSDSKAPTGGRLPNHPPPEEPGPEPLPDRKLTVSHVEQPLQEPTGQPSPSRPTPTRWIGSAAADSFPGEGSPGSSPSGGSLISPRGDTGTGPTPHSGGLIKAALFRQRRQVSPVRMRGTTPRASFLPDSTGVGVGWSPSGGGAAADDGTISNSEILSFDGSLVVNDFGSRSCPQGAAHLGFGGLVPEIGLAPRLLTAWTAASVVDSTRSSTCEGAGSGRDGAASPSSSLSSPETSFVEYRTDDRETGGRDESPPSSNYPHSASSTTSAAAPGPEMSGAQLRDERGLDPPRPPPAAEHQAKEKERREANRTIQGDSGSKQDLRNLSSGSSGLESDSGSKAGAGGGRNSSSKNALTGSDPIRTGSRQLHLSGPIRGWSRQPPPRNASRPASAASPSGAPASSEDRSSSQIQGGLSTGPGSGRGGANSPAKLGDVGGPLTSEEGNLPLPSSGGSGSLGGDLSLVDPESCKAPEAAGAAAAAAANPLNGGSLSLPRPGDRQHLSTPLGAGPQELIHQLLQAQQQQHVQLLLQQEELARLYPPVTCGGKDVNDSNNHADRQGYATAMCPFPQAPLQQDLHGQPRLFESQQQQEQEQRQQYLEFLRQQHLQQELQLHALLQVQSKREQSVQNQAQNQQQLRDDEEVVDRLPTIFTNEQPKHSQPPQRPPQQPRASSASNAWAPLIPAHSPVTTDSGITTADAVSPQRLSSPTAVTTTAAGKKGSGFLPGPSLRVVSSQDASSSSPPATTRSLLPAQVPGGAASSSPRASFRLAKLWGEGKEIASAAAAAAAAPFSSLRSSTSVGPTAMVEAEPPGRPKSWATKLPQPDRPSTVGGAAKGGAYISGDSTSTAVATIGGGFNLVSALEEVLEATNDDSMAELAKCREEHSRKLQEQLEHFQTYVRSAQVSTTTVALSDVDAASSSPSIYGDTTTTHTGVETVGDDESDSFLGGSRLPRRSSGSHTRSAKGAVAFGACTPDLAALAAHRRPPFSSPLSSSAGGEVSFAVTGGERVALSPAAASDLAAAMYAAAAGRGCPVFIPSTAPGHCLSPALAPAPVPAPLPSSYLSTDESSSLVNSAKILSSLGVGTSHYVYELLGTTLALPIGWRASVLERHHHVSFDASSAVEEAEGAEEGEGREQEEEEDERGAKGRSVKWPKPDIEQTTTQRQTSSSLSNLKSFRSDPSTLTVVSPSPSGRGNSGREGGLRLRQGGTDGLATDSLSRISGGGVCIPGGIAYFIKVTSPAPATWASENREHVDCETNVLGSVSDTDKQQARFEGPSRARRRTRDAFRIENLGAGILSERKEFRHSNDDDSDLSSVEEDGGQAYFGEAGRGVAGGAAKALSFAQGDSASDPSSAADHVDVSGFRSSGVSKNIGIGRGFNGLANSGMFDDPASSGHRSQHQRHYQPGTVGKPVLRAAIQVLVPDPVSEWGIGIGVGGGSGRGLAAVQPKVSVRWAKVAVTLRRTQGRSVAIVYAPLGSP